MIYIVGGHGFVGSAYVRLCQERGLAHQAIEPDNYQQFVGTECDVLINANGNSSKVLATRDPLKEFDLSVRSVADTLASFRARTYVFLSTGDVYPDPSNPETSDEATPFDIGRTSRYGLHKYLAERLVTGAHPDWLIMRMGGFVGPGIRKNAIFDMLTGAKVWLAPDSQLQFIHTDNAARLVMRLVERGVRREVVNLGAEGLVEIGDLCKRFGSRSEFDSGAPSVRFELSLAKLKKLVEMPLPRSQDEVMTFAAGWPQSGVRSAP